MRVKKATTMDLTTSMWKARFLLSGRCMLVVYVQTVGSDKPSEAISEAIKMAKASDPDMPYDNVEANWYGPED